MNPQLCSFGAPVIISLDVLIREWKSMQRQYEENSSHPLKAAKQGKDNRSHGSAQRRLRPLSYPFEVAAHSWSREVPKL